MGNLASIFKNCTCNVQIDEEEDEKNNIQKDIILLRRNIYKLENKHNNITNKIDNLENKIETKIDIIENKIDSKFDLLLLKIK